MSARDASSLLRAWLGVVVLGSCALTACTLGPDYARPKVDVPANFRFADTEVSQTASPAWWQQFNDPVLNDLIATALANNKDVKVAAARIDQFRAQFVETRSQLFPQVSAGFDAQRQRLPQSQASLLPRGVSPVSNSFDATLGVSWEIDLFGRIRRETESANASLLSSVEARRATILSLVASVASTYVTLRALDAQLDIAKATTESRKSSVDVFTLRFKGGEVSQMELAQSQSEYEASAATIPQLESQIGQTEDALSILLGQNPGSIARGRPIDQLEAPVLPAGLPSDLLERRPDVLEAEQNLVAANALIGAARALYFPQISLTGVLGTESAQLSNLFTGPTKFWNLAGSVAQPIFTAGNITGQVHQAEAQQQQALYTYEKTVQSAFQEVDDNLIGLQKSREQLGSQSRQVDALATYAHLARLRYEGGYTSYIEVLDAERSLFSAQLSLTQTRGTVLTSTINLYKAMGGAWVLDAETRTEQSAQASTEGAGDGASATPASPAAASGAAMPQ
ncbi:Outer membrane protein OprM [Pararobbsia alpina]|uniref:efflux transporter outer membrane subunit n=1 Tax=Pararobbsia alpina TaxID=621374 RepID=UPI0039A6A4D0